MSNPAAVDILIVDDNPGKILALRTSLDPLGQNIVAVANGREALRQLLGRDFATVVLDVHMPGMDGFETAQMIRARPRSAHTPIIFVSAINLAETDALRGYALGAVDYIFAPIIPEVLRAKVSVFVELHRKTEEARRHAREVEERTSQLEASQQRLRLVERMAALGTLSTGLGHDMGNLLLPLQAQLESIDGAVLPPETSRTLADIRTCIGHLRRLADGLRMLAIDPERTDAAEAVTEFEPWWGELEAVLRTVLPVGVALESEADEGLPPIRIARHLLTQVVFNLVQNAADALAARSSGRVRVSARPGSRPGTVRVEVADDGPGMEEQVRLRCLEPFFTTKRRGISTGLGLSLVSAIVGRAGGELSIVTRPGEGCVFSFDLPAAAVDRPGEDAPRAAVVDIADRRLASLAASLLRSSGWTVRLTADDSGPNACLLLADEQSAPRAAGFLDGADDRTVLFFSDGAGPRDPRFVQLARFPSPLTINRALQDVMNRGRASPRQGAARPTAAACAEGS